MAVKRKRRAARKAAPRRKHVARKNPTAAKLGKWYRHPAGGMVRVRNSAGKIVVDIKK